jgi:hypothetical protein
MGVGLPGSLTPPVQYGDNFRLADIFSSAGQPGDGVSYLCILWESIKEQKIAHKMALTLFAPNGEKISWQRLKLERKNRKMKAGEFIFGMVEVSTPSIDKASHLGIRLVIPGKSALKVDGGEADEKNTRLLIPLPGIRGEAARPVKPSAPKPKYTLITTLYNEQNPKRVKEYIQCLKRNRRHPSIDGVHVLYDTQKDAPGRQSRLSRFLEKTPGITKRYITSRPTYEEIFEYANANCPGTRIIVCNADIYFNETLALLNNIDLENRFLALSRWDVVSGEKARLIHDRLGDFNYMSADAWLFKTPLDINFTCDYRLGTIFCDSFLNAQLFKSGLKVYNPCFDIQACHLHKEWKEAKLEKSEDYSDQHKQRIWQAERLRHGPYPGVGVYWCKAADLAKEPREPYIWGLDRKKMEKNKRRKDVSQQQQT